MLDSVAVDEAAFFVDVTVVVVEDVVVDESCASTMSRSSNSATLGRSDNNGRKIIIGALCL